MLSLIRLPCRGIGRCATWSIPFSSVLKHAWLTFYYSLAFTSSAKFLQGSLSWFSPSHPAAALKLHYTLCWPLQLLLCKFYVTYSSFKRWTLTSHFKLLLHPNHITNNLKVNLSILVTPRMLLMHFASIELCLFPFSILIHQVLLVIELWKFGIMLLKRRNSIFTLPSVKGFPDVQWTILLVNISSMLSTWT